jgi:hypothetical protein
MLYSPFGMRVPFPDGVWVLDGYVKHDGVLGRNGSDLTLRRTRRARGEKEYQSKGYSHEPVNTVRTTAAVVNIT